MLLHLINKKEIYNLLIMFSTMLQKLKMVESIKNRFFALLLISNVHHIFQFLHIFSDASELFTNNFFSWWKPRFHAYTWCFQLCFSFHTHQDIQNPRWASFALPRFWHNKTALKSLFDGFNRLQFLSHWTEHDQKIVNFFFVYQM